MLDARAIPNSRALVMLESAGKLRRMGCFVSSNFTKLEVLDIPE